MIRGKDSYWYTNSRLHNTQQAAVIINENYRKEIVYYINGRSHRGTSPAYFGNVYAWKSLGILHREEGPALLGDRRGEWVISGKYHCEDGPAIMDGNIRQWWLYDRLNRVDGPAAYYISTEGYKSSRYYIAGVQYEKQIYERIIHKTREAYVKKIQRACRMWLDKPITGDGKMGIRIRIGLRKCYEWNSLYIQFQV